MTTQKYSIAICPPAEIIDRVDVWKNELRTAIGWYNSVNSKAHITIAEFSADDKQLELAMNFLKDFCRKTFPFEANFTMLGTFPNGAFFLAPDQDSKPRFETLMRSLNKSFRWPTTTKATSPHISIGRKLDAEKIAIAHDLFQTPFPDFFFNCDRITLRQLDPIQKQFFVHSEYLFQSESDPNSSTPQLTLF